MNSIGDLITVNNPRVNGRTTIAGTGVSVRRIAGWHKLGRSPQEIVDTYGHINLAQVYAALAHYYANQEQIDAELAEDDVIIKP